MKHNKLSKKMLLSLIVFSFLLIAAISVQIHFYYRNTKLEEYRQSAYAYARTASEFIDGDKVLEYVETGVKDKYYEDVQYFFDCSRNEADMKYYYVFVPYEDDLVYVWDGMNDAQSQLGDREGYMNDYSHAAVIEEYVQDPPEKLYTTVSEDYGNIATAYYPIYNSDHEPVAVVGVDLSVSGIDRTIRNFTMVIVWTVVLITILGGLIFYFYINRRVVKPLTKLNRASKNMVSGLDQAKEVELNIHTGDELEELSGSFKKMYVDLQEYIDRLSVVTAEKERIGAELNVATAIQRDMLPRIFPAFPEYQNFDIYAMMDPAKEVGGDFYDFFLVDEGHLGLVIADVSGKGVPAALFMVIAKTLIKNRAQMGGSPGEVLHDVNRQLSEGNDSSMFVTVWFAIIDIYTGEVISANAGHEHPVLRRKGGNYELVKYRHSPAMCVMDDINFMEESFQLNEGDRLFVYTDGVPEATNKDSKQYGTDRMLDVMNAYPDLGLQDVLKLIREDINDFVQEAPQFDDITMLIFDYFGKEKKQYFEYETDASLDTIDEIWAKTESLLEELECPMKAQMQIELSMEELLSNVANYAYTPDKGKIKVIGRPAKDRNGVTLTLIDQGIPYDPTAKEDPDVHLPASQRKIGGLGIYLVKQNMDSLEYERRDGSNVVTITKYF